LSPIAQKTVVGFFNKLALVVYLDGMVPEVRRDGGADYNSYDALLAQPRGKKTGHDVQRELSSLVECS